MRLDHATSCYKFSLFQEDLMQEEENSIWDYIIRLSRIANMCFKYSTFTLIR